MGFLRALCVLVIVSAACGTTEPRPAGDPGLSGDPGAGDSHSAGDPAGDPAAGDPVLGDPGDPAAGDAIGGGDPGAGGDPALLTPCGLVFPPVVVLEATVGELNTAINAAEELAVVDVRESGETASGIIAGALLYPWTSGNGVLSADHAELPDDRPLYIICASGNRSRQAAGFLVANGHTCVHTVLGGMGAWNTAGYPTVIP